MSEPQTARIRDTLSGFGPVWQRVTGTETPREPPPPPPPPRDDPETLRQLLQAERQAAICGQRLARLFRGRMRTRLLAQAGAARERARTLRAELFLRSGERQAPPTRCPAPHDRLSALREAIDADRKAARDYTAAAGKSGDAELARLYGDFAARREADAKQKREILRGLL